MISELNLKNLVKVSLFLGALFFPLNNRLHATGVLIAIDNTGANDPVNVDNPRVWNFAITSGTTLTVNRALFGLNDGDKHTDQDITFSLYSGLGGNKSVSNSLLFSVSLTPNQVDGFYTTMEEFTFGSNFTISAGDYSAMLTTTQPAGNGSYFLKLGKLGLYNDTGGAFDTATATLLSSALWTQDANTTGTAPVPEPSALSLLAVGLGGLAILRRRRS